MYFVQAGESVMSSKRSILHMTPTPCPPKIVFMWVTKHSEHDAGNSMTAEISQAGVHSVH